ncbi:polysaccharide biosynthesis protein [Staphylococcus sp. SQ8-PEA]|uniref:Polysaccharide biosynthesis protein n=1 Tax=Staphylococcus marylandisciuri TaxID=2981529 RepID=A0ABT2QSR9_9STAP|nr:polysaccharide biosynthesis protein [Staphylococcus marylandisciuri]MCU5747031.1 polysaccharide biosynthesis protein [Staphylococcus marylandisciuri]
MKSESQSAFNGVVILTAALIIVKILSALYRVPYQNVLGDSGLYAYQQVYPLLALGAILSATAVPSALTQTLNADASAVKYTKILVCLQWMSLSIFVVCLAGAPWIAKLMGDEHLAPIIRVASTSFLFVGVLGVLRGYYQAHENMTPPAISQVIEQLIRVIIIFVAIGMFVFKGWNIYLAGALSIGGSALGGLGASLFLAAHRPFKLTWDKESDDIDWKQFFLAIVIFAISQLIVLLWQIVDSFTVIHTLKVAGLSFNQAITQKGTYDRGASFIQVGLIITTSFSFVLIPLLAKAVRNKEQYLISRYTNASLKVTVVISTAAGIGLINLLPSLNIVFFENNNLALTLSVYMLTVIFVSLIMMYIALLQVMHCERRIVSGLATGLACKVVLNITLIPFMHILGTSVSTVASLLLFACILHFKVRQLYNLNSMRRFTLKLGVAMLIMTVVVQCLMFLLPIHGRISGLVTLLISAIIGIVIVVITVVKLKILSYKEIKHLPLGDKIINMKRGRR